MTTATTTAPQPAGHRAHWLTLLPLLAIILLALSACTTPPTRPTAAIGDPATLQDWRAEGKLGFRSPQKNGSAFVRWQQQNAAYELQLNGPFGAGSTVIQGDDSYAVLSQSGRDDLFAASGEELSEQLFGWPFPVTEMTYWIKGLAAPSSPATTTFDKAGLLTHLEQQGWQLEFSQYSAQGDWTLPGRIKGARDQYSFILVIKQWTADGSQ